VWTVRSGQVSSESAMHIESRGVKLWIVPTSALPTDVTTKDSSWSVAETVQRLTGLMTELGMTVFATIGSGRRGPKRPPGTTRHRPDRLRQAGGGHAGHGRGPARGPGPPAESPGMG
jgi:hypothetical protein